MVLLKLFFHIGSDIVNYIVGRAPHVESRCPDMAAAAEHPGDLADVHDFFGAQADLEILQLQLVQEIATSTPMVFRSCATIPSISLGFSP